MTPVAVSLEQARAAKSQLSDVLGGRDLVVGIGVARSGAGWQIKVNLVRDAPELDVPAHVDGVPVTVEVVGRIASQ